MVVPHDPWEAAMIATTKDLGATALTVVSVGVVWLNAASVDVPVASNVRLAAIVALLLGVGACAMGAQMAPGENGPSMATWHDRLGAVLGGLSGVAAIVAVIFGWQPALIAYGAIVAALWAVTTVRHLATPRVRVPA
jgi:hypothetical protein